jgi:hypothetical protein
MLRIQTDRIFGRDIISEFEDVTIGLVLNLIAPDDADNLLCIRLQLGRVRLLSLGIKRRDGDGQDRNAHCATRLRTVCCELRCARPMSKECARFEPVAWWFTRSRIGRALMQRYDIPTELPSNLLAVSRKLEAIEGNQLFREFQRGDLGDTANSAIGTNDLVSASERSIAELDAPAPAKIQKRLP